jgi:hypothetical protein
MMYPIISNDPGAAQRGPAAFGLSVKKTDLQAELGTVTTIEFSDEAEARLLKSQGQSVAQIAVRLRLDEDAVSAFFYEGA